MYYSYIKKLIYLYKKQQQDSLSQQQQLLTLPSPTTTPSSTLLAQERCTKDFKRLKRSWQAVIANVEGQVNPLTCSFLSISFLCAVAEGYFVLNNHVLYPSPFSGYLVIFFFFLPNLGKINEVYQKGPRCLGFARWSSPLLPSPLRTSSYAGGYECLARATAAQLHSRCIFNVSVTRILLQYYKEHVSGIQRETRVCLINNNNKEHRRRVFCTYTEHKTFFFPSALSCFFYGRH